MRLRRSQVYAELVAAALRFNDSRLWDEYEGDECFALQLPDERHPLYANIMGQNGEEFGLLLVRGEAARNGMRLLSTVGLDAPELSEQVPIMGFSMTPWDELPPFGRRLLEKAGRARRRGPAAPLFMVKEGLRAPRSPSVDEAIQFLYALTAIVRADAENVLAPADLDDDAKVPTLFITGDPRAPEVRTEMRPYDGPPAPAALANLRDSAAEGLRGLPVVDGHWLIVRSGAVHPGNGHEAFRGLLVADAERDMVVMARPLFGGGLEDAVEAVAAALAGSVMTNEYAGVPRRLTFGDRALFEAVKPLLDGMDVDSRCDPDDPALARLADTFLEHLRKAAGLMADAAAKGADPPDSEAWADPRVIPAPSDYAGWHAVRRRLQARVEEALSRLGGVREGAKRRYFGSLSLAEEVLADENDLFGTTAFIEWFWLDFRAGKRCGSAAERLLRQPLPQADLLLARAWVEAAPSLYRVVATQPEDGELTLTDLLLGGDVVVRDHGLAASAPLHTGLPARVYRAGAFHFLVPMGPALLPGESQDALDFLLAQGMERTPASAKRKAHLFGRLWAHVLPRRRERQAQSFSSAGADDQ